MGQLRVRYLRLFDKSLEDLSLDDQKKVADTASSLLDYFSGGPKPLGLGLRKLQGSFWKVRASLDKRILFLLEKDLLSFVIVGNHDEIHRYLIHH